MVTQAFQIVKPQIILLKRNESQKASHFFDFSWRAFLFYEFALKKEEKITNILRVEFKKILFYLNVSGSTKLKL
jgi:hypothetical protein